MDCIAGFMAVIDPETVVRVNWVKSCWSDDRLVAAAGAVDIVVDEEPVCSGDIRFGARLQRFQEKRGSTSSHSRASKISRQ